MGGGGGGGAAKNQTLAFLQHLEVQLVLTLKVKGVRWVKVYIFGILLSRGFQNI